MLKKLKNRFIIIFMLIVVIFVAAGVQLSNLTMAQGEMLTVQSEDRTVRTLTVKGSRGQILDITGIPLAYDQSTYDVEFTRDPSKNTTTDKAYYTSILIETIRLIEENEGEIIDTFNIVRGEDGAFGFDFGVTDPEAVKSREENWRSNMSVSKTSEPDVIYRDLRNRYRIPEEYGYEEARKLLSVWQEIQLSSYRAYIPVTIAQDVPMETVAVIEARSDVLDGVSVVESSTRVYPKDDVAAHIIGYTGKIVNEESLQEYKDKGYDQSDTVGITGVENTWEAYLTGNSVERQGERKVEVNSRGKVIQEISNVPATAGNDIMLTIDMEMQMTLEEALGKNVQTVHEKQLNEYYEHQEKYDEASSLQNRTGETTLDKMNLAQSGAAVVMDVHTGDVMAMASYPSFDLNLFVGGISNEDYEMLSTDEASPLFNKAISSKGTPGSIFKMVTGLAGLTEGVVTLDDEINDEGLYDKYIDESYINAGGRAPACWGYTTGAYLSHTNQTIVEALRDSCNYFFYEVADRLTIDRIVEWSDRFGLITKTNIELPAEVTGQVGNQEVLYNPDKDIDNQKTYKPQIVRNALVTMLKGYGEERGVEYDQALLEETATALVELAGLGKQSVGAEICAVLSEKMEIPETIAKRNGWNNEINQTLSELIWNNTKTLTTGIGTEPTLLTPIAVARYVAAVVNGGYVYDAHIVDSVIDSNGNVVEEIEPEVWHKIDAPPEAFEAMKEGLRDVVSNEDGNTATASWFKDWKYKDEIGGKTGTGKVSDDVELENNAWFVAFAPYDEPEIAVVVYIPNGWGGNHAIDTTRDIIEYYLDGKEQGTDMSVPAANSVIS
ncbi:hypothetical protein LJC56_03800 [Christensenellaceae bacterium OttesenSCG-928-K19]|nr:hypothetical protein [Christensenellaceae bacterium OttesenSCG-928-K19]